MRGLGHTQPPIPPRIEEEYGGELQIEAAQREEEARRAEAGLQEKEAKRRPRKRRGKRQRGSTMFEVMSLNTSGMPQLLDALTKRKSDKRGNVAVLSQEHHRRADNVADLRAAVRRQGWRGAVV